jgi:hypothetical protein
VLSHVEGKSTFLLLLLPFGFVLLPYLFVAYGHGLPDRRLAVLVICLVIGLASGHRAAFGQRAHPGVALVTAAGFYLATKFVSLNARPVVTVCGLAIAAALLFGAFMSMPIVSLSTSLFKTGFRAQGEA